MKQRSISLLMIAMLAVMMMPIEAADAETDEAKAAWQKVEAGALLIDVRSPEEYAAGHLENAVNIPHDQVLAMSWFIKEKSREVVLYCGSGRRAGIAAQALESMGYEAIFNGLGYQAMNEARERGQ